MNQQESSRVIVFGGGFNPPTNAHANIMKACLELPAFDEVWVMPSGDRVDKQMAITDEHRLNMLNLVKEEEFENDSRLVISDFELKLPRPNQTIETIGRLANKYTNIDFWYAYGVDAYYGMPNWSHGAELQSYLNMIIFNRGAVNIPKREGIINLKIDKCDDISSTDVREMVTIGLPIGEFVCNSVNEYIKNNGLYLKNRSYMYEE